jgi:hypothetical protein
MNWIYEGFMAAFAQIGIFAGILVLTAAALWSCQYLGIPEGYAVLSFYAFLILFLNLFFSWKSRELKTEVEKITNAN